MPTVTSARARRTRRERHIRNKCLQQRRRRFRQKEAIGVEECYDLCQDQGYHLDPDLCIGTNPEHDRNRFTVLDEEDAPTYCSTNTIDFEYDSTPRIIASPFGLTPPPSPPARIQVNIPSPLLYHAKSREALQGLDSDDFNLTKSFPTTCGQSPPRPEFESYKTHPSPADHAHPITERKPLPQNNTDGYFVAAALPMMGDALFNHLQGIIFSRPDVDFYKNTRSYLFPPKSSALSSLAIVKASKKIPITKVYPAPPPPVTIKPDTLRAIQALPSPYNPDQDSLYTATSRRTPTRTDCKDASCELIFPKLKCAPGCQLKRQELIKYQKPCKFESQRLDRSWENTAVNRHFERTLSAWYEKNKQKIETDWKPVCLNNDNVAYVEDKQNDTVGQDNTEKLWDDFERAVVGPCMAGELEGLMALPSIWDVGDDAGQKDEDEDDWEDWDWDWENEDETEGIWSCDEDVET